MSRDISVSISLLHLLWLVQVVTVCFAVRWMVSSGGQLLWWTWTPMDDWTSLWARRQPTQRCCSTTEPSTSTSVDQPPINRRCRLDRTSSCNAQSVIHFTISAQPRLHVAQKTRPVVSAGHKVPLAPYFCPYNFAKCLTFSCRNFLRNSAVNLQ